MRKLRIAMLCDPIAKHVAGSFVSALRFSERLQKKGHTVIFIAAKYPGSKPVDKYKGMRIYRFRSILLPRTEKQLYLSFPRIKEVMEILSKERIDVLHVIIPTPSAVTATKAAKKLGIRIVAHSHTQPENLMLTLPKILRSERLARLFYKYMLWIYKKADIIICPSKLSEQLLKDHDAGIRTTIISNGVPANFKKVDSSLFFKKYHLQNKKRILFVGRLHPEKNIETLLKAMPLILEKCDVHLDIVGAGYLDNDLKKLAEELEMQDHITFYGKISNKDLILAYNACDIFVLPSLAELEGMAVLEAMACGKPVLVANTPASASVHFVKGNGYLFLSGNPKDLAKKALLLLNNSKLRKMMALKSHQISKEYDIDRSVELLEKVYVGK